jgi:hypothetical protein
MLFFALDFVWAGLLIMKSYRMDGGVYSVGVALIPSLCGFHEASNTNLPEKSVLTTLTPSPLHPSLSRRFPIIEWVEEEDRLLFS